LRVSDCKTGGSAAWGTGVKDQQATDRSTGVRHLRHVAGGGQAIAINAVDPDKPPPSLRQKGSDNTDRSGDAQVRTIRTATSSGNPQLSAPPVRSAGDVNLRVVLLLFGRSAPGVVLFFKVVGGGVSALLLSVSQSGRRRCVCSSGQTPIPVMSACRGGARTG